MEFQSLYQSIIVSLSGQNMAMNDESFTSNVRSLIKMSPLGVASGVWSNLQNKNENVALKLSSICKCIFKCRIRDQLDDVVSVDYSTTSRH